MRLRWSAMTEPPSLPAAGSLIPSRPAGADATVIRLGPSAAARCRRRIHLDTANADQRIPVTRSVRRAIDELTEHRDRVLRAFRDAHGLAGSADPNDDPSAADAGRPPADRWREHPQPMVLMPNLATGARSGSPDILLWAGDGYQPVIIRAHRTRDAGAGARVAPLARPLSARLDPKHRARRHRADRLALAHHYRQLVDLGCASATARGGVIGRGSPTDGAGRRESFDGEDDATVIVWHHLDSAGSSTLNDYDRRFSDRVAIAGAAVAGGPALAFPSRVAECRRCQWWPRCSTELRRTGDISLLLTGDDVQTARDAGVGTIADVAGLAPTDLAALVRALSQGANLQVRARAWLRGTPLVRSGQRTALRRADVEVDVDAESYVDDGAYLWGALLSGADVGVPAGYRSFVTWEHLPSPEQGAIFGAFFQHLVQIRDAAADRGLSCAVFCYGKAAEERWMLGLARRYAGLPGVPDAREVAAFCASPQWSDLMAEISRQFVLPGSLRLKELAGAVGFAWRDPEPGGENSMAWYREAIGIEPGVAARPPAVEDPGNPMAQRVLRYNEDDVLATLAVRRWITEHLSELPTVAELEADTPAAGAP